MAKAETLVPISKPENLERVLLNPELFIRAIPGARFTDKAELKVSVKFRILFFSTADEYKVVFYTERNGYAYEFRGKRGRLLFLLRPEGDTLLVRAFYNGRFNPLVSLEFKKFSKKLAENLESLISTLPSQKDRKMSEGLYEVDFDNLADFKRKLYGFLLESTEEIFISEGTLKGVLSHLVGSRDRGVYYISGISLDGRSRFQILFQDGKVTSVRYIERGKSRIGRLSLNPTELERILNQISGNFVVNVWRKIGRVGDGN